ncbi:MAG: ABC transporter substrate-binding protein [Halorhabdus sp.]
MSQSVESGGTSRRSFLKAAGVGSVVALAGCQSQPGSSGSQSIANTSPADEISVIAEDLPATAALQQFKSDFEEQTGIGVNIELAPYLQAVEKINQQFAAESARYDAIYSDPYANVAAFPDKHVRLDRLATNDNLKDVPKGVKDFFTTHVRTDSIFSKEGGSLWSSRNWGPMLTLPYDASTLPMLYRTDVFENEEYSDAFEQEHDFPFQPGPQRTWDQIIEMSRWINENVPDDVVPYGYGGAGKQHDALQLDFNTFFWAHGGENIQGYSGEFSDDATIVFPDNPQPNHAGEGRGGMTGPEILSKFVELYDVAHPSATSWAYGGVISNFGSGEFAMGPVVHEAGNGFEADDSPIKGKWDSTLMPQGSYRSVTHFGPAGMGINKDSSLAKQRAAWKFITWATSTSTQVKQLTQAGGSFTRHSTWTAEPIQQAKTKPPAQSSIPNVAQPLERAWQPAYIGMRPHTKHWNSLNEALFTNVSKAINHELEPQEAMQRIDSEWSDILGV